MIVDFAYILGLILGGHVLIGLGVASTFPALTAVLYGVLAGTQRFRFTRTKFIGAIFASIGLSLVSLPENGCYFQLELPFVVLLCAMAYGSLGVSCVLGFREEVAGQDESAPWSVVLLGLVPVLTLGFSIMTGCVDPLSIFS